MKQKSKSRSAPSPKQKRAYKSRSPKDIPCSGAAVPPPQKPAIMRVSDFDMVVVEWLSPNFIPECVNDRLTNMDVARKFTSVGIVTKQGVNFIQITPHLHRGGTMEHSGRMLIPNGSIISMKRLSIQE